MSFSQSSRQYPRLAAIAAVVLGMSVVAAGAQAPGNQQKTMLVEPPSPLLPATLENLSRVAEGDIGDGLGALDPAQAPVLKEDGLRRFAQSDYAPDKNARPHVNV